MDQGPPINYETIIEGDEEQIENHYGSIIDLKKNEMKINLVLDLPETDEEEKQQLKQLKQNIQTALKEQLATLKEIEKKKSLYPLSLELLTMSDVGKLTKCFISSERKWKNAEVVDVDVQEQIGKIQRYGQEEAQQFPAYYLKVLKEPDPQLFKEGTHCKSIYSVDGEFYPCIIEKIDKQGYHVKYKKYNSKEIVKLHRLRPTQNNKQKQEEIKFQNLVEFKVPDKLKILPNDPQNVKKAKKKKLKAYKYAYKNAKIDDYNNNKKEEWKSFNENSGKTGHFRTKYDMEVFQSKQIKK